MNSRRTEYQSRSRFEICPKLRLSFKNWGETHYSGWGAWCSWWGTWHAAVPPMHWLPKCSKYKYTCCYGTVPLFQDTLLLRVQVSLSTKFYLWPAPELWFHSNSLHQPCLKCLFLQNRFLHGMAWHANANATVPPSSSASKADPVPVWTQPNLSSLIIHILVKRLTWLLKTFYHVEDQTRYQIQIQIQIQLLIPIWVKRLTCVLTTFDYGEDQTHWQSLWHPQPNWERPANTRAMFQKYLESGFDVLHSYLCLCFQLTQDDAAAGRWLGVRPLLRTRKPWSRWRSWKPRSRGDAACSLSWLAHYLPDLSSNPRHPSMI